MKFEIYTPENAPEASKPILEGVKKAWNMVPNLHGVLAESPLALETHNYIFDAFEKSSFTPVERQVILMTTSYENNCEYCMAGHSALAKTAQVPEEAWLAIRDGKVIGNPQLEALHKFTTAVVANKGWVDEAVTQEFLDAGYTKAQILELLIAVSLKVMSSYTNHFAHTPLDDFQKPTAWKHPSKR